MGCFSPGSFSRSNPCETRVGENPIRWVRETAHRASDDAKARAFDSYMSYTGRYHLEGDEVVHTVELALTPEAVGQAQRRRLRWEGATLALSYTVQGRQGPRHYLLSWTRAELP